MLQALIAIALLLSAGLFYTGVIYLGYVLEKKKDN